jgi:hypothetical protein
VCKEGVEQGKNEVTGMRGSVKKTDENPLRLPLYQGEPPIPHLTTMKNRYPLVKGGLGDLLETPSESNRKGFHIWIEFSNLNSRLSTEALA